MKRTKIISILIIFLMLMPYIIEPVYSASIVKSEGDFRPGQMPYDIEFVKVIGSKAIDNEGHIWAWGTVESNTNYVRTRTTPKKCSDLTYIDVSSNMAIDTEGKLYAMNWVWSTSATNNGNVLTTPTEIGEGGIFTKVTDGLAINKAGYLYAYGNNSCGKLGTGDEKTVTTLTPVKRGVKFKDVSVGGWSSLAIDTNGNLYFCGKSDYGTGGSELSGYIYEFTKIMGEIKFEKVSVLNNHCLAIDIDGNLYGWGMNWNGELGIDTTTQTSSELIKIKDGTKFKEICAGSSHSIAIDEDGNLWSWGYNRNGNLGYETDSSVNNGISKPQIVMNGTKFQKLGGSTKAIDIDGNLWAWGSNENYNFGDGTTENSTIPIQITGPSNSYSVNFYNEDGTTLLDTQSVKRGNAATSSVTPTKESTAQYNYTFDKWVAMDGSDIDLSNITQDTNVKAKYRENLRSYNVKFVDENGTTILNEQTVSYGNKATYNGVTPSKSKYGYICTFKGWDKDPNTTTITEDTVFTAQYNIEIIPYTIMYENIDGATFANENRDEYTVETEDFTLNNPTAVGYTFQGWEGTDLEGRQMNVTVHRGSTGNRTYKAVWTANTDTAYKVEHYKQRTDGTYANEPDETENKTGATQSIATATIKTYPGYSEDTENPNRLVSANIKGDGTLVLKVYYKANTSTPYRVEHYLQNLDNTNYTIDNEATENKTGTTGTETIAETKAYDGFTAQSFEQKIIAGDGSTVIKIYYNRNRNTAYTVEHYKQKSDGTYPETASETESKTGITGDIVTATAKQYTGYTEDTKNTNRVVSGEIAGDGSLVLKLYYKANTDTAYIIEHYKQNADGTYPSTASERENKTGTTGIMTTAEPKQYAGYTEDTTNTNRIVSGTIYGDGSLVLKLYYKANTSTSYKVEHYKQNADGTYPDTASETENSTGTTGASVTATAKTYEGYTEDTTNTSRVPSGTISGDGSLVLKLYYKANTSTSYKVEHYKQNADGTYPSTASETENGTGTTGASVIATAKQYAGYTEDTANTNRVPSGMIAGDGSLVLKLYYKANTSTSYKVEHYKQNADGTYPNAASETEEKTGTTGEKVTATAKQYEGYVEDTANVNRVASGEIAGDGSLVLKLYYKANTNTSYKIEHYKQKADGTYPDTASETENKIGITGAKVTATAKQYAGYTEDTTNTNRVPSGMIAEDGNLVLKLYYKANTSTSYKVEHYKQNVDGTYPSTASETENGTGTTGASVTATAKTYAGYTEDATNINRIPSGTISGDGNLVLKLYYKANTNTAYKVEHYKQNPDGTYPDTASETEENNGVTGASVTATAKTYAGYTEDTTNTNRVSSGTISGDGSLVLRLYYKTKEDDNESHIKVTPGEDEDGKKNIEISSDKEIDKVTVNGKEVEKDENGKYIYYPDKNGTYEIEVTYKDGTKEKVIYEEIRMNNNNNNSNKNTNTNSNKKQTSGTKNDNTLATKILSKTGRTYMGVIVILIVTVMSIIVLTKKYRDDKNN